MGQNAQQYTAPYIYNALAVAGVAGAAKTLRTLIEALTGGVVPPKPITGFLFSPSATIRMIGGYDFDAKTFLTAVKGGGYMTFAASASGYACDIADPLDNIAWLMDGAGAGTMDVILFTDQ